MHQISSTDLFFILLSVRKRIKTKVVVVIIVIETGSRKEVLTPELGEKH